jgi:hypothetical protein
MSKSAHFVEKDWDLDFKAELYKQEFYATGACAGGSKKTLVVPPWDGSITAELRELRRLKEKERPDYIGDIIREQDSAALIKLWYDLLGIGRVSHPWTSELLHATMYLAGSVATFFKAQFDRVRPASLMPDLAPPIPTPRLPAYPGGHATQIHLMALTLMDVMPDRASEINERANRVALNRERAGVNYPSDTVAGRELAEQMFRILRDECQRFRTTFAQAKNDAPLGSPADPDVLEKSGLPV